MIIKNKRGLCSHSPLLLISILRIVLKKVQAEFQCFIAGRPFDLAIFTYSSRIGFIFLPLHLFLFRNRHEGYAFPWRNLSPDYPIQPLLAEFFVIFIIDFFYCCWSAGYASICPCSWCNTWMSNRHAIVLNYRLDNLADFEPLQCFYRKSILNNALERHHTFHSPAWLQEKRRDFLLCPLLCIGFYSNPFTSAVIWPDFL